MPLHDVLSSVAQLILNARCLPESEAERLVNYKERFPNLTPEEREDLAKIKPHQLQTYTVSIFSAQRKILRSKFPVTFALLEEAWPFICGEKFNGFEFVRRMHEKIPWRGNQTSGLIENFCRYVMDCLPELAVRNPFIDEVLLYERTAFELFRDQAPAPQGDALTPADLGSLTVNQLLDLPLRVPSPVKFLTFRHSIPCFMQRYIENGRRLDGPPSQNVTAAIASRNRFLDVRWSVLPVGCLKLLEDVSRGTPGTLGNLGSAFVDNNNAAEVESFSEFIKCVALLMEHGAINIPSTGHKPPHLYTKR